jgi:predicted O-methyltransferase YrrM
MDEVKSEEQPKPEADLGQFDRWMHACSAVPGWMTPQMAGIWDCLLSYQKRHHIRGHLFEIGVMGGRSAALLAMHAAADEALALNDTDPMTQARALIGQIKGDNVLYLECPSQGLDTTNAECVDLLSTCRWIHIDGEHSEAGLDNDLKIANALLADWGVISVDDFMSPPYPHLTRATFKYLESHCSEVSLFLCGFNKAYLCRPTVKHSYLYYIKEALFSDMIARGLGSITVWKTNTPSELNCFGVGQRVLDLDYFGLETDPTAILI